MNRYLLKVPVKTLYVTHIFDGEEVVRGGEDGQAWIATFASSAEATKFIETLQQEDKWIVGAVTAISSEIVDESLS